MVQISQLAFEFDQRMISARNVTGAARTCAHACSIIAPVTFGCCDIAR